MMTKIIITNKFKIAIILAGLFLISSCTTYIIPVESFKNQFSGIDSAKLKEVKAIGPIGESHNYLASPIQSIKCVDKKGNAFELKNSPSIEICFTYGKKNKKAIYYFDRIFVSDSSVVGVQSRFISSIRKTIPLQSIKKIEIQDGKKNFHYGTR